MYSLCAHSRWYGLIFVEGHDNILMLLLLQDCVLLCVHSYVFAVGNHIWHKGFQFCLFEE